MSGVAEIGNATSAIRRRLTDFGPEARTPGMSRIANLLDTAPDETNAPAARHW